MNGMMEVNIYLPVGPFWHSDTANRVIAEGLEGYFTLLPRHIDYVAALLPGILTIEELSGSRRYFALDHGTLTKQGRSVAISTLHCVEGDDIATLAGIVEKKFKTLDEAEKKARAALVGLEHSLMRRFAELRKSQPG